jgi:hypothetical protein
MRQAYPPPSDGVVFRAQPSGSSDGHLERRLCL